MSSYEVEIKSLLGSEENAKKLRNALHKADPSTTLRSKHKQLNHYFINGDPHKLIALLSKKLPPKDQTRLKDMGEKGKDFSVRSRDADGKVIFVMKASLDSGSSHNTVSRMEFEAIMSTMTLEELDELILSAGYQYQAKWSREREEYTSKNVTVCLDKNAGYGYLAEFEKVVETESLLESAKEEIRSFMKDLEVSELPQDRLERMFAFYNAHWGEYYGTDKIFVVE